MRRCSRHVTVVAAEILGAVFLLEQPILKLYIPKTEEKWKTVILLLNTVILLLNMGLNLSSNPEEILWTDRERLPQHYEQGKEAGLDKVIS